MGKRLIIATVFLAGLVICLIPIQTVWDDGLWPLSVTVVSASNSPITSVSCEAFLSEESARYCLEHLAPPDSRIHASVADPFRGEPLAMPVPTSLKTRSSLLWSSGRYNQKGWLVVIAQYQDGRQEGRLATIPDLRENRSLRVEFP
ncbi:MAG: hypothetical protein K8T89_20085 [Planctomycetes bacterium]|nr:hypothetical protein [Planctomycetota bacterium]